MRTIGEPLTAEESAAFIAAGRSLVNRVRFRHQGRDPKTGLDCAGLVKWMLQQIGRAVFDLLGYGRDPHKKGLYTALVHNLGNPIQPESMRAGDVILMRFRGAPRHVGIVTQLPDGRLGLLHVHAENKVVSEHGLDGYHADIVSVFRP